ncbi:DUF3102 domain-containing protein [Comamonas koreensis]|uniref:DUF3102 domain-containing protein n=1 Tax=Comamonas koreensis TaxID=160825 RepID=A0AAW4XTF2_9BURK|nr:DUF3102 domain-containing protein [Comamonas koreensis]MCD2164677.1 DUF3102 domain-containing protein [Comamonas koreensis]
MSRPTSKTTPPVDAVILSETAEKRIADTQDAIELEQIQSQAQVRAIALQVGYLLPADSTDPDLIQRDIAANLRRSAEACLEVGRGLMALKAACPHGEFGKRIDVLGIEAPVASRFMAAARKFSNLPTSANLTKVIGTQSRLFEMLVLDDEQIEELALTGESGDLKLDDVATMSVKELRSALRQAKEDNKFIAKKRDDEQQRADRAEKALRAGGPKARSLEELVVGFHKEVDEHQDAAMKGLLNIDLQITALETWYMQYVTAQPEFEPGERFPMPVEVLDLVQKLSSNVGRIASAVGGLQRQIWNSFGHELESAPVYQMETPAEAVAA